MWELERHDLNQNGQVHGKVDEVAPLSDVFIKVAAIATCEEDSTKLA